MNVALQDHFKWLKKSEEIEKEKSDGPKQGLDLRFKEGETIKINMKITKKDGSDVSSKSKSRPAGAGLGLPPPPGGFKIAPPPAGGAPKLTPTSSPSHQTQSSGSMDLLGLGATAPVPTPAPKGGQGTESWGEFNSAAQPQPSSSPSNASWVQF